MHSGRACQPRRTTMELPLTSEFRQPCREVDAGRAIRMIMSMGLNIGSSGCTVPNMTSDSNSTARPPLHGVTVIEFGGIGPGPFAAMLLADMGADVHRLDRPGFADMKPSNSLLRGRSTIRNVDLKTPSGLAHARELVDSADVLVEGFRPGVMERLGLGPAECHRRNPQLIYGRLTGWGQDGPYAQRAGHDINYLSISGVLDTIGRSGQPPLAPLNFVADYGGGAMFLVAGILAALIQRFSTGSGVVVDAAMVDGAALMLADVVSRSYEGTWSSARGTNLYDSGAHFYEVYETSDARYMAVGAVEPQFYAQLLAGLGITDVLVEDQNDTARWPQLKDRFRKIFLTKSRDEWRAIFDRCDACVTPVLSWKEAALDVHMAGRETFTTAGAIQLATAPRFYGPGAEALVTSESTLQPDTSIWHGPSTGPGELR